MQIRLLVGTEDEDGQASILRGVASGWTVDAARSGTEAITLAAAARPDVVFVSPTLPEVRELLYAIRSNPESRHVPIVLLVSRGELDKLEGIDDYLVTPADPLEVAARVRTLIELSHLREAAYRGRNDFLSLVGHKLRNPLSALSTAVHALSLRAPSPEAELMSRSIRHLTSLVDDLLSVSRLARGVLKLQTRVIELARIVDQALEMLAPRLGGRSVSVSVPRVGLGVEADPDRLAQVIANVLLNAVQHTETAARIVIESESRGDRVRLWVKDSGGGIAPEQLPAIFDSFLAPHTAGQLGLGLAIARGIVELHGGTIQMYSAGKGRGAECSIELPITARKIASVEPPIAKQIGRKRLLLVEDNDDAAQALKLALEQLGYSVSLAHNGPIALAIAEEVDPDVALLDLGLPVMDGWELAKRLREKVASELPVVAVTALDQEADKQRSSELGFAAHFVKPIDVGRLQRLVESLPKSRS